MMKVYFYVLLILNVFGALYSMPAFAQAGADSAGAQTMAVHNAAAVYHKAIGAQSSLYNGPLYSFYNANLRGSAYFQEGTKAIGDVEYDGIRQQGVPLIYDIYKDQLVTYSFDGSKAFTLIKALVQSFDISGHHFINISADTLPNNTPIKGGYYDELYHGRLQALSQTLVTVKEVTSSIGTPEAFSTFSPPDQKFFLRKAGIYYRFSGKSALLDLLKDKKKQLKAYIKANRIDYGADPAPAMAKICAYYDSLSQ